MLESSLILAFFRNSGGIPPGNLATIFIASSHCIKPLSPGCGVRLNLIFVSSTVNSIYAREISGVDEEICANSSSTLL